MADDSELRIVLTAVDDLSGVLNQNVEALNDLKNSVDDAAEPVTKLSENTEGLHTGMLNLAVGLEVAEKAVELLKFAYESLEAPVEKAIEEALEQQKSQDLLSGALVSTGQYSAELAESIGEYTEAMEKATGVDSALTQSNIATGIQMGLTAEKSKQMAQAAVELSSVYGGDVNKAFSTLQQTLAGHSRSLALVLPQVKDFSAEQLKQGDAIGLVTESLKAQSDLYQQSLPAAYSRAKASFDDIFKSFGQAITASPLIKTAMDAIGEAFNGIGDYIKANKGAITDFVNNGILLIAESVPYAITAFEILDTSINAVGQVLAATVSKIIDGYAAIVKLASSSDILSTAAKSYGLNLDAVSAKLTGYSSAIKTADANQTASYLARQQSVVNLQNSVDGYINKMKGQVAAQKEGDEEDKTSTLQRVSNANAVKLAVQDYYGGFAVGTLKMRDTLTAEESLRQGDLKKFTDYYNDKIALAVSKEAEQAQKVAAYKATLVKDVPTASAANLQNDAEIKAETNKQIQLKKEYDLGLINKQNYDAAVLLSTQKIANDQIAIETSKDTTMAKLLTGTRAALQLNLKAQETMFNTQTQQTIMYAAQQGATQEQINQLRVQKDLEVKDKLQTQSVNYYEQQAALLTRLGDFEAAEQAKMEAQEARHGKVMGDLISLAYNSQVTTVGTALSNMGSLMNAKNQELFNIGKAFSIASAIVSTAQGAAKALEMGPILGPILAATVIAQGAVQIANISSQSYQAQAHGGMDEVPSDLDNSTFILKAGERVVQPEANKDLTAFLAKHSPGAKSGVADNSPTGTGSSGSSGPTMPTIVNINVSGSASPTDMQNTVQSMIKELRRASERGDLILNKKAVYG